MKYKDKLVQFKQNRVWRSYKGGKVLDDIAGKIPAKDAHFPEDWIASTTKAVNPGREHIEEGESVAILSDQCIQFSELIALDPEYFLGHEHVEKFGINPMVLVKFLDSSIRLHFQAHPTREFSQQFLNSDSGKAEAYYILKVREDINNPYIYLGFQHPPKKEEFKNIIINQDIATLKKCFEKVPVEEGQCYFIPGGMPHAIGEGIMMIEIMEPSDWAVRFEFERGGYTLPEEARFMKRDLDFCLDVFDYSQQSIDDVVAKNKKTPIPIETYSDGSSKYMLIDASTTDRYRVCRSNITNHIFKQEEDFYIGIVTRGECTITLGDEQLTLRQFDKFFCPAGVDTVEIKTAGGVEIIECYPPLSV
ncbi:class I mannose-6-phosphate isomerase [Vibrio hyugaensis]|uniref:Mannose-6-phosphate isomerase n=1 Tax=Vibrio hyugaensis TaxID=1534743 RepID=A0ABQ5Y897_9VIBR|nr:class I mannose-6-phosphate isomerase [Vibrio hyugaensis]GLR06749.1 mannose-6-phosphate isomerase [Vibrio hyugaensis]